MKEPRKISVLLAIMIEPQCSDWYNAGLCLLTRKLRIREVITSEEENMLDDYIDNNVHTEKRKNGDSLYWDEYDINSRKRWVKRRLEIELKKGN